ncbi:unnamed protein product [Closterium sp. NIES-53]
MASTPVLAFDAEGRPVKFETWLDDLHLFLQLTAKEDISLYDHALGHATAPAATADSTARSQWQTRDAHARFAIRNSLPIDEREHFGQHKTAQALYTAVVARYSSPASAALGRLSLPYLFPDLASFHTVGDLITHLRTSEARFRAAMPYEFLAKNPPPLWLTLYHLVTRLPDTLRSVRDHFLARCLTELTIALLEKDLLAAEASIVAVGASRGDPHLGEPPRSPLVLYVDNKAMLALCREQRLEHRTKHIALRYFLARELQQRGQLRLAYVASEANTADVFTKALAPCDHQRFCTQLGLVSVLPHLLTS